MMREAVCFSVVLKSIWVGEYNTINQHNCKKKLHNCKTKRNNCKKNGTTAKLYVGIIQEISTTAKNMAQLQKQKCTTAKKSTTANTCIAVYIFWQYLTTNSTFHFSFPFLLISTLPRHPATATKLPPAEPPPAIA